MLSYKDLVFDPTGFYVDLDNSGLKTEALALLFIGLVGFGLRSLAVVAISEVISLDDSVLIRLWRTAFLPLVGIFFLWISSTVVFYVHSWLYRTDGNFSHLLKNTAWGMTPFLFVNILKGTGATIVAWRFPADPVWVSEANEIVLPVAKANFIWDQILTHDLMVKLTILSWLFILWSGYICAHGIAEVRNIERRKGYQVVIGPIIFFLLYSASRLLGATAWP